MRTDGRGVTYLPLTGRLLRPRSLRWLPQRQRFVGLSVPLPRTTAQNLPPLSQLRCSACVRQVIIPPCRTQHPLKRAQKLPERSAGKTAPQQRLSRCNVLTAPLSRPSPDFGAPCRRQSQIPPSTKYLIQYWAADTSFPNTLIYQDKKNSPPKPCFHGHRLTSHEPPARNPRSA